MWLETLYNTKCNKFKKVRVEKEIQWYAPRKLTFGVFYHIEG